jgi:hypothetical protein
MLSEKKKTELYNSVSKDIMDARIEVQKLIKRNYGEAFANKVDEILYKLSMEAPQNALNVFNTKKK